MEQILFDATANQKIPFRYENGEETVEVSFILGPQTDEAIAEYDRLKNERYQKADEEAGDRGAMETIDETARAAVWLLNDRLIDCEGFGEEGEEKPPNWKDLVFDDDRDRVAVIDEAYLAAQVVPPPLAPKGKRLPWQREPRKSIVNLVALFNGHQLQLTHERTSTPTADQIREFESIRKSRYLVTGRKLGENEIKVPPKARRFAALYDSLGYQTTGYAEGSPVPLHHRVIVVVHDLGQAGEAVKKA
jgi:hypothetical protein